MPCMKKPQTQGCQGQPVMPAINPLAVSKVKTQPPPLPPRPGELQKVPQGDPLLAELQGTQQKFQTAALKKFLEVNEKLQETISEAPPKDAAWNGTFEWNARFAMQVTNTDLIVLLRLKLPDVNWGNGDVPARAKWCYNIGLARSGCSIFWKPKGATKDTEVREYPIKGQIEAVNKGEHHSFTAQHASTVGHGGTEGGGGTRDMTNWGVLDKTDIGGTHARQSGELLHNCIQQHNSHMGDRAPEGQGDYE